LFFSSDGLILKGWIIQKDKSLVTIIFCHGLGMNKSDLLSLAKSIYDAGFNLFLFDFRGHGDSSGSTTSFGYLEERI